MRRSGGALARVVVGLSGGVDSAVSALLLQRAGHSVSGLFVQSWDTRDETGQCPAEEEWKHVTHVCQRLGVACTRRSFVNPYWTDVFEPMLAQYQQGLTPNPDADCNRHIKFGAVARYARNALGADLFATGHYAQLDKSDVGGGSVRLLRSPDRLDQTLFLSRVSGEQLRHVVFPVGHLTKNEVRAIAREAGLHNAERRSSIGICFIGKREFGSFLGDYITMTAGTFVDVRTGLVVGQHSGAQRYTIGQRARVSGAPASLYVAAVDPASGTVLVAPQDHDVLLSATMSLHSMSWVSGSPPSAAVCDAPLLIQCRHTAAPVPCHIELLSPDSLRVMFPAPRPRISPGQVVALYHGNECLGGALVGQD